MINRSPSPGDVIMKDRSPSPGDKLDCLQLEAPESALESVSAPESLQLAASESVSALESLQLAAPESVSAPESLQLAVPESSHLLPAKEWFIFVKVCLFVCVFLFFHIFGLGWAARTSHIWVGLGYILIFFFFFFTIIVPRGCDHDRPVIVSRRRHYEGPVTLSRRQTRLPPTGGAGERVGEPGECIRTGEPPRGCAGERIHTGEPPTGRIGEQPSTFGEGMVYFC